CRSPQEHARLVITRWSIIINMVSITISISINVDEYKGSSKFPRGAVRNREKTYPIKKIPADRHKYETIKRISIFVLLYSPIRAIVTYILCSISGISGAFISL